MLQHGFAQPLGIALPGFRKLDYLLRDDIVGNVAAINKPKRYQCHFISKTHEPHGLRVESLPFRWDRIGMRISANTGGSATELSATDAWAKAAAVGISTTCENRLGSGI